MRRFVRGFYAFLLAALSTFGICQLPEGLKFDDGFTWIECKNSTVIENSAPIGNWTLQANVRLWGKVPNNSGWKFVVSKGGTKLAEYMADGYPVELNRSASQGLVIVGFWKEKPPLTATGLLDVQVYYIDGNTNKEYLARTCKVDVRKVESSRGSVGTREKGPDYFYVNRHSEVLSNILYFREVEYPSYTQLNGLTYYSDRVVELVLNYSENENFSGPAQGRILVEVDGKQIEMMVPNNRVVQDNVGFGNEAGKYNVEHSDRNADKYFKGGPPYKERIGFCRRSMILPLQWGPKPANPSQIFTTDHPGNWKITYLIDRKPVRIFRFKIGANGLPEPHAEQVAGLNLAPNAILVETEIPGEGGEFDGRLTSEFVKLSGFFGRPWATQIMKQLAAAVPQKNKPFPVPSDKQ